jgi:hypothetical protein
LPTDGRRMVAGMTSPRRSNSSRCTWRSRRDGTEAQWEENFARVALKWCKADQDTENRVVSLRRCTLFHKLINTCVENLTELKYFLCVSARFVLRGARIRFLGGDRHANRIRK